MPGIQGSRFTVIQTPLAIVHSNDWGAIRVYVEAAPSPDSVVLQRSDCLPALNTLETDIRMMYEELTHRYPDKPNPKKLKKGKCYAIYSSRKRRWVRATSDEDVPDVTEHRLLIMFNLVDYCVDEMLHPSRARHLPNSFSELPAVGYLACYSDPFAAKKFWTAQECKTFRDFVLGKYIACKPVKFHPVKLINMVKFYVEGDSINQQRPLEHAPVPRPHSSRPATALLVTQRVAGQATQSNGTASEDAATSGAGVAGDSGVAAINSRGSGTVDGEEGVGISGAGVAAINDESNGAYAEVAAVNAARDENDAGAGVAPISGNAGDSLLQVLPADAADHLRMDPILRAYVLSSGLEADVIAGAIQALLDVRAARRQQEAGHIGPALNGNGFQAGLDDSETSEDEDED